MAAVVLACAMATSGLAATAAYAAPPSAAEGSISPSSGSVEGGTEVTVAVTAPAGVTFTSVSAGWYHSLALGDDGKTYAWGSNSNGQLGNGETTDSLTPVLVNTPTGVTFTSVSAGAFHSLAVGSNGKVYAWGYNYFAQLGNGETTDKSTPVVVNTPPGVTFTSVSAGRYYSLAVGSNGTSYAWGWNNHGQLGGGQVSVKESTPVVVNTPTGVTFTSVSAGGYHSLAVGSDGNTYAWGYNDSGQLGNGETTDRSTPVLVATPTGVTFTSMSAGDGHSLAIGSNGKVYAWGWNAYGQLGNGETTPETTPVVVNTPDGVTFTSVSVGHQHSLAVGSNGKVYAWGWNNHGQLGNGETTDRSTPVLAATPTGMTFTNVSAGTRHSLAVGANGETYAWGSSSDGQLGNGETTGTSTPVVVRGVVVSSVLFDGVAGTNLTVDAGAWKVTAPAHTQGTVDVVIEWTQDDVTQAPLTLSNGYSYIAPPDAPTSLVATPGNGEVSLTWAAPAFDGGSPITDYVIEYQTSGDTTWSVFPHSTSTDTNATITGLTNGTSYEFRIAAVNAVNMGVFSGSSAATPMVPTITDLVVSNGLRQVLVSWTAPAHLADASYKVTVTQNGSSTICETTNTLCAVTGLEAGPVTVSVTTISASKSSAPVTGTGTVLSSTSIPGAPPENQGGATLQVTDSTGTPVSDVVPGQVLTVHVTGFAPGSWGEVFAYSTPASLGGVIANALGMATFQVTVPTELEHGTHTLVVFGLNPQGETATASATITVNTATEEVDTTEASEEELVVTGAHTGTLIAGATLALLLLLTGATLALIRRAPAGPRRR